MPIGSVLVQAVGAPITASGFVMDAFQPGNILALEVPGSGLGNESPSFSAIATGLIGHGIWGFALNLSLPNSVSPSVIASATYTNLGSTPVPYSFEADVTVTNGIPSGTWNLFINSISVASGSLTNFPTVPYQTSPTNPLPPPPLYFTTKIRRTLVLSLNVTQVGNPYPVYNTIFSDSFQRANENPLNPTNWTTLTGYHDLQIVSNQCIPTFNSIVNGALCTTSLPNDQWAEFKISTLPSNQGSTGAFVRTNLAGTAGYLLSVTGPAGVASATITLQSLGAGGMVLGNFANANVNIGDVFRLVAQGSTISVLQNGSQVIVTTDSTFASGSAGLRVGQGSSNQAGVTNFNCGSVSNGFASCTLQVSENTGYTGVPVTTNSI
jgi:hypothetical protein